MNKEIYEQIIKSLDHVGARLVSLDIGQARIEENLKEHMRRENDLDGEIEDIKKTLTPIQAKISQGEGVLKFIGVTSLITTICATLYQVFI